MLTLNFEVGFLFDVGREGLGFSDLSPNHTLHRVKVPSQARLPRRDIRVKALSLGPRYASPSDTAVKTTAVGSLAHGSKCLLPFDIIKVKASTDTCCTTPTD